VSVTTNDGVRLRVTDEGSGPVVVLLAGYGAPLETWAFQQDALLAAGYRVVSVDRRSHGGSDVPAHGQRMARHGKDLEDVLAALDLREATLVGGSMGASTIWAYVDLFGTERVRGVVSVDQTPRMRNGADWPHGFYGLTDENSGTFFAETIPPTDRGLPVERQVESFQRLAERLGPDVRLPSGLPEGTLPLLRDHAQQDWRDVVARVEVPFLMLAGRESQFWPCEHAAAAVGDSAFGRAVVVEDCGHAMNLDRPDAVNHAVLSFLEEL
jgi:non-heme chloroperoxidase